MWRSGGSNTAYGWVRMCPVKLLFVSSVRETGFLSCTRKKKKKWKQNKLVIFLCSTDDAYYSLFLIYRGTMLLRALGFRTRRAGFKFHTNCVVLLGLIALNFSFFPCKIKMVMPVHLSGQIQVVNDTLRVGKSIAQHQVSARYSTNVSVFPFLF